MTVSTPPARFRVGTGQPPSLPAWWPIARTSDQFQRLESGQCRQLLPSVGRGWLSYPQQPHTTQVTVNYRVHGQILFLQLGPASALGPAPLVLFRVDHLDTDRQYGWTIVIAGPLRAGGPHGLNLDVSGLDQPELALDLVNVAGRSIATGSALGRLSAAA